MRFSVVVPVYNVEQYLSECLDSVFDQDFDDFEVIVVNDGSTDKSLSLCEEYVRTHKEKMRLISQPNHGLLMARRVAIKAATGDYIVCLDSDDGLRHDALSVLDKALRRTDADLVSFQASRDSSFANPYMDYSGLTEVADAEGMISIERARLALCTTYAFNSMWCKAIRRNCIGQHDDYRGFEGLQYGEDLLQVASVLDKAKTICVINDILYFYRDNPCSISHSINSRRMADITMVRGVLGSYAAKWNPAMLPRVHANSCIEVLAHCVIAANRLGRKQGIEEISDACSSSFWRESISKADFSDVPHWKKTGISFLSQHRYGFFYCYIRALFLVLRLVSADKAARYI